MIGVLVAVAQLARSLVGRERRKLSRRHGQARETEKAFGAVCIAVEAGHSESLELGEQGKELPVEVFERVSSGRAVSISVTIIIFVGRALAAAVPAPDHAALRATIVGKSDEPAAKAIETGPKAIEAGPKLDRSLL